jgi:hypothetical protein
MATNAPRGCNARLPLTNAQRQAAYRSRRRAAIDDIFAMRGLPSLPAIATIPGWPRWKEAMTRIGAQMEVIESEMTAYYGERSERWQESEQAQAFDENREILRQLIESVQSWPE